jgi:hypothetical protein
VISLPSSFPFLDPASRRALGQSVSVRLLQRLLLTHCISPPCVVHGPSTYQYHGDAHAASPTRRERDGQQPDTLRQWHWQPVGWSARQDTRRMASRAGVRPLLDPSLQIWLGNNQYPFPLAKLGAWPCIPLACRPVQWVARVAAHQVFSG